MINFRIGAAVRPDHTGGPDFLFGASIAVIPDFDLQEAYPEAGK